MQHTVTATIVVPTKPIVTPILAAICWLPSGESGEAAAGVVVLRDSKMRSANSQKHITQNGIAMCVLYWIHTKKVRTNISNVSFKYITAKVCNESHHRCPICGLYYAGKFTGTIDIALAVCLIKTFCLAEWGAVNGRLLSTKWRRHDSIVKLQNKLKATHTLPISLLLWSPGFPLIFDHFKAVISSEGLSIDSTDSTLTINNSECVRKSYFGYYLVQLADNGVTHYKAGSQYDSGASMASQASGWCWNRLNFYSSIASPALASVQPIRLSKNWTSGIEFD